MASMEIRKRPWIGSEAEVISQAGFPIKREFHGGLVQGHEVTNKIYHIATTTRPFPTFREQLEQVGQRSLLAPFDGSLSKALISIFPNCNWQPWRFSQIVRSFWEDERNHFQESAPPSRNIVTLFHYRY
jgi:hypothetical protein